MLVLASAVSSVQLGLFRFGRLRALFRLVPFLMLWHAGVFLLAGGAVLFCSLYAELSANKSVEWDSQQAALVGSLRATRSGRPSLLR